MEGSVVREARTLLGRCVDGDDDDDDVDEYTY